MKLRFILLLLALMAFISASSGGYFYYSSLRTSFLNEVDRNAALHSSVITSRLSSFLTEQLKPVRVLAALPEIRNSLSVGDEASLSQANAMLDRFQSSLGADVCYILDEKGNTIASSNRQEADSFVGNNFSFRPYFKDAIRGSSSTYMALGTTSGKRGVYFSFPVSGDDPRLILGVAVIKASIAQIEKELSDSSDAYILLVDSHSIIFISNYPEWLFQSLRQLSLNEREEVMRSYQFGIGPWPWTGLTEKNDKFVLDKSGKEYLIYRQNIESFPGWQIVYLRDAKTSLKHLAI